MMKKKGEKVAVYLFPALPFGAGEGINTQQFDTLSSGLLIIGLVIPASAKNHKPCGLIVLSWMILVQSPILSSKRSRIAEEVCATTAMGNMTASAVAHTIVLPTAVAWSLAVVSVFLMFMMFLC